MKALNKSRSLVSMTVVKITASYSHYFACKLYFVVRQVEAFYFLVTGFNIHRPIYLLGLVQFVNSRNSN